MTSFESLNISKTIIFLDEGTFNTKVLTKIHLIYFLDTINDGFITSNLVYQETNFFWNC